MPLSDWGTDMPTEDSGTLAVIASGLTALASKVDNIDTRTEKLTEFMVRFDEKQRGWATKHELTEQTFTLRERDTNIEKKADRAHERIDTLSATLSVQGAALARIESAVTTSTAEQRGAWKVTRPVLGWIGGILAAVIVAYVVGRFAAG